MNKTSKAYSIILYLIWPFSAFLLGLKYFESKFGKNLIIAAFAFLGFTASSFGDLDRYESSFYNNSLVPFEYVIQKLLSFQTGKFYNDIVSFLVGVIFSSHHFYFLILFLIFGYLLVNSIYLIKSPNLKYSNKFTILFFIGFALYYSIGNILNLAFYTGGLFVIYNLIRFYKFKNKKYLFYLFFCPLFHIGLSIYICVPVFLFFFNQKIIYYLVFVITSLLVGQSSVVKVIGNISSNYSDTVVETKYKGYASEAGQKSLEKRYEKRAKGENAKLKTLFFIKKAVWYFLVPLGLMILILKRKTLIINQDSNRLFRVTLLCWGISNLMLNISQGERFLNISCLLAIALLYRIYIEFKGNPPLKYFRLYLRILQPTLLLLGLMSLVASHFMIPLKFYTSNYFIEIYNIFIEKV